MRACSLPTSLRLPFSLYRPPCLHSPLPHARRSFASAARLARDHEVSQPNPENHESTDTSANAEQRIDSKEEAQKSVKKSKPRSRKKDAPADDAKEGGKKQARKPVQIKKIKGDSALPPRVKKALLDTKSKSSKARPRPHKQTPSTEGISLEQALKGTSGMKNALQKDQKWLDIKTIKPDDLNFEAIDVEVPPIPMLSYGLDRVLFNPGIYRLQDPRSMVYNFDPYLEKIMSVDEFDFSALSEYKTSSKDEDLLALTQRMGTKFTGSTSSMSGVLQHFHFLLSNFRPLNHEMLSRQFPQPSEKFSKITEGPSAVFLRWKDGIYAIDADKGFDSPNIMSWLGHSLEKLLTVERQEFEKYRRSSTEETPGEDQSSRCYHYSKLGNFLMRSQLDAHDPRLPGSGVFDLKTRAVVSIRMNHEEYEAGKGYQIRYDHGEWESFEREFYDMTRATMLKYSLQVRMGRMDGIFVAYHNVERIFGFQYLSLPDMDLVLHGQKETCLGDQEFKLSVSMLDEVIQKAIEKYPETTLRMHFHTPRSKRGAPPFMYIFAEPMTEEQADEIQNKGAEAQKAFARDIVGIGKDDPEFQKEWHEIQDRVDEELKGKDEAIAAQEDDSAAEHEESDLESHYRQAEDVEESTEEADAEAAGEGTEEATEECEEESAEDYVDETAEESSAEESVEGSENEFAEESVEESAETVQTAAAAQSPSGPLLGWTLAVRHRVNGSYVDRPAGLGTNDSWTAEYHIQEIKEEDRWALYEKVKNTRNLLIGEERNREDRIKQLARYRDVINNFSVRGRKWRDRQDALAAEAEQKVYQPLGPGSQAQAENTA